MLLRNNRVEFSIWGCFIEQWRHKIRWFMSNKWFDFLLKAIINYLLCLRYTSRKQKHTNMKAAPMITKNSPTIAQTILDNLINVYV